jgi:[histone H3]-lysine36 N-dimethyltransferase SETMAR
MTTVQRWAAEFSRGRKSLADDLRSGHPSTSTNEEKVAEVEDIVFADRRVHVVQIALELGILVGSVSTILHDHLGLSKFSAR